MCPGKFEVWRVARLRGEVQQVGSVVARVAARRIALQRRKHAQQMKPSPHVLRHWKTGSLRVMRQKVRSKHPCSHCEPSDAESSCRRRLCWRLRSAHSHGSTRPRRLVEGVVTVRRCFCRSISVFRRGERRGARMLAVRCRLPRER